MSVSSGPPAIAARGLRRTYNVKPTPVVALDGVDLEVAPGEFFGLLAQETGFPLGASGKP